MIIKFTDYNEGVHHLDFDESASNLKLPEEFSDNVKVSCKMDKSVHQIVLDCELTTSAKLRCDRCNEDFVKEIQNDFRLVYLFSSTEFNNDESEINLQYLSPETTKIDISEEVNEYCLLAVPLKLLCKEDCKGLCVSCGINLNLDNCTCKKEVTNPIWEKLNKLKDIE